MINSHKVTKHACTSSWSPLAHSIHHTYHQVTAMNKQQKTKAINNSYIYIYISHVNVTQTVPDISPLMPMHQDPLLVLILMRSFHCLFCISQLVVLFTIKPSQSLSIVSTVYWEGMFTNLRQDSRFKNGLQQCQQKHTWHTSQDWSPCALISSIQSTWIA